MPKKTLQTHNHLLEGFRALQLEYLLQSDSLMLLHYVEHRLRNGGIARMKQEELLTPLRNLHQQLEGQQEQITRMVDLIEKNHADR